jgi:polysaccharide pyruvyl transferase WcaK-like protein
MEIVMPKFPERKMIMKNNKIVPEKVVFFGHFDSTNFGNESTLQAILHRFHCAHPHAEMLCISTGPEAAAATHQIESLAISEALVKSWRPSTPLARLLRKVFIGIPSEPYRWIKGFITLGRTRVLIVPGTGLLTDAWGVQGWGPYNSFKWSLLAKLRGCKLMYVSVGAGPVHGNLAQFFVKSALSLADARSYRDYSTKRYLKSIGFSAEDDPIYPDLVFGFPETMIPPNSAEKNGRRVVGLGLMIYAGNRYSVNQPTIESHQAYLENLALFVKWLLARDNDVRLLIGDLSDISTKQEFHDLLKSQFPECDSSHIIDEPVFSVESLLPQITATDIVVATRFHNVLFALLCNKPVIAISFHHKCESLMAAMGLSDYCLDIGSLRVETLIEKFCDLETNADRVRAQIKEKVRESQQHLDEMYQSIFQEVFSEKGGRLTESIGEGYRRLDPVYRPDLR